MTARWPLLAPLFLALAALAPAAARGADLPAYLDQRDDAYHWEIAATSEVPGGTMTVIKLTSQRWQGITWEHWLRVIAPTERRHDEDALLIVAGGRRRDEVPTRLTNEGAMLPAIAARTGAVVALLEQVPNQPLFDNLREDGLIAYTFKRFLETKDESWPALLPMTRSAIRAMDAVQEWSQAKLGKKIARFTVTGASKRGWTTWLTAAADPRVRAIAPMVIDVLNMPKQMPHQLEMFGDYSEEIVDYTALGLPQRIDTPEAERLLALIDPFVYRERLTMPKLIVLGTNDPYWPVDAVNLYFGELPGEKYIHYEPNTGHGLGPGAIEAIGGFYETVLEGEARPRFTWTRRRDGADEVIAVAAQDAPVAVDLWTASAQSRDFRKAKWSKAPVDAEGGGGAWLAHVKVPETGYMASYVSLTFRNGLGHEWTVGTSIEVRGAGRRRASF
jgi:PhoPQ-activated pathogenicity-related protein